MILENDTPLHVHNPSKIKRKHGGIVVSEPEKKEYKVFKKSLFMDDFNYFPYGYDYLIYLYLFTFMDIFI